MLLYFSVENYLSFKGKNQISFEAGTIKEHLDDNSYLSETLAIKLRLLKCLGVYGHNSSGKSNFMKAFSFMRNFVVASSKDTQVSETIEVEPFTLNTSTENKPSTFEVKVLIEGIIYRYGFSVSKTFVVAEWLTMTVKHKEQTLFVRAQQEFQVDKKFNSEASGKSVMLTEITRRNALYLSVLAQFSGEVSKQIVDWFNSSIIVFDANTQEAINFTAGLLSQPWYKQYINQVIRDSNLGIVSVEEEYKEIARRANVSVGLVAAINSEQQRDYEVKTKHQKFDENDKLVANVYFSLLKHESLGTQRLFGLLGPILQALNEKRLIWIDEFDSRLHNNLFETAVSLFNSKHNNPKGAQLVFTAHNANQLKKNFRRDQMLFVEKDIYGASNIGSLYERNPKVRSDASFDKDYLSRKYVNVPFVEQQLKLFS